jgi:hypothetical protein
VLKTSSTIVDQNFSILIDLGAIERFVSSAMLKRIKVKEFEQDEFRYIEMASGDKQKVGAKVMDCRINLGDFVTKVNIYVMILGSYDIMISLEWLESHDVILNCKTKWLILTDDMVQSRVIVGRNQGVSLRFISSLQLQKSMHKGCKLYTILALNEKGDAKGLENLLVVSEFSDVFREELPGLPPKR